MADFEHGRHRGPHRTHNGGRPAEAEAAALNVGHRQLKQFEADIERYRPDGPPPNNIICLPAKT